jgi:hypothetical protein
MTLAKLPLLHPRLAKKSISMGVVLELNDVFGQRYPQWEG